MCEVMFKSNEGDEYFWPTAHSAVLITPEAVLIGDGSLHDIAEMGVIALRWGDHWLLEGPSGTPEIPFDDVLIVDG